MDGPVFIFGKGTLDCFRTIRDAEAYIEPIDIRNDEYVAYNSAGNHLRLEAHYVEKKWLGFIKTKIETARIDHLAKKEDNKNSDFLTLLDDYLRKINVPTDHLAKLSLEDKIQEVVKLCGYTR